MFPIRIDTMSVLPEAFGDIIVAMILGSFPMRVSSLAVLLMLSSSLAFAADAPPSAMKTTLVRGTIQSLDAKTMTITTDAGSFPANVTLATRFAAVEKRSFSQIKPTDFVGITSVPGKNGHLSAEEIHVIPLKGLGEGQYPWAHHPSTATTSTGGMGSMTNGSVTAPKAPTMTGSMTNGTVTTGANEELNVTYHGAGMV